MLLGHYGVALAAKRASPRSSLGTLIFAAQWADLLWPILLLAGFEHVRITPGLLPANPLEFISYPISHGLLALIGWGVLFGFTMFAVRRDRAGAWTVGLLVVSHWLLDLIVHQPDLPILPGTGWRVGLGLWKSISLTVAVELVTFGIGVALYVRTTRARDRAGRWGLWGMVALLLLVFASGFYSPPPPDVRTIAIAALGLWLFVPWGWWVDRHREEREVPGQLPTS